MSPAPPDCLRCTDTHGEATGRRALLAQPRVSPGAVGTRASVDCSRMQEVLHWAIAVLRWEAEVLHWAIVVPHWEAAVLVLHWAIVVPRWAAVVLHWAIVVPRWEAAVLHWAVVVSHWTESAMRCRHYCPVQRTTQKNTGSPPRR